MLFALCNVKVSLTRQNDLLCFFVPYVYHMHIVACWCLPEACVHLHAYWESTRTHYPKCTWACLWGCGGVRGYLEAGRVHRSAREGGSLQLLLHLPTGCEGHWCDSTNYRGRKPELQTFTAAAQLGSAGLKSSSTSHFTPLIPPRWIVFQECHAKWDIIHIESSQKKHCFDL